MNHDDLTELQQNLDNAKHVVFLTGAGVSTHSGIPDYRSKNGNLQWRTGKSRDDFK